MGAYRAAQRTCPSITGWTFDISTPPISLAHLNKKLRDFKEADRDEVKGKAVEEETEDEEDEEDEDEEEKKKKKKK